MHCQDGWKIWNNEGVKALNDLSGEGGSHTRAPSRLQRMSLQHLASEYESLGKPPCDLHPAAAFRELCKNSVPYLTEDSGPRPYQEGLVSLPSVSSPISLACGLDTQTFELVCGQPDSLLNNDADRQLALDDLDLSKPYIDPAFNSPKTYASFITSMFDKNLVEFQPGGKSYLGVFFVAKKNGKLRVILDTRIANCYFRKPDKTRLPTAAALSSFESTPGESIYFCGGDIDNAFYRVEAPACARPFLTLPPIRIRHLRAAGVKGLIGDPNDFLVPRMIVLPMGWSWSLLICQRVHEFQGECIGQSRDDHILDRSAGATLSTKNTLHAKYVDNFLCISHDPNNSKIEANKLESQLNSKSLVVHEVFGPDQTATFAGLDFDGRVGSHKVRP